MAVQPNRGTMKYLDAERRIMEQIGDGGYPCGAQIPSEADLSEEFGMARMTVRKAIDRLVDRNVLERRPRVGTFVASADTKGGAVAFLIFHQLLKGTSGLGYRLLEVLRARCRRAKRELRVNVLLDPLPPVPDMVEELRAAGVQAVGLGGFTGRDRAFVAALASAIPCVLFNKPLDGVSLPCAQPDFAEAARLAVGCFAERKRCRVGVLLPNVNHSAYRDMGVYLSAEMHRHGLAVDRSLWFEGTRRTGFDEMDAWLFEQVDRPDPPDGLITLSSADALVEHLAARGETPGDRVDIISCSNEFAEHDAVKPWPVIFWNMKAVVDTASDMLVDVANDALNGAPLRMAPVRLLMPEGVERRAPSEDNRTVPMQRGTR